MAIEQISVFVENKHGRLAQITSILGENGVDIQALSIADTTDYGILRLIVNDPKKAEKVLKEAKYTVSITKVLGIALTNKPGAFATVIKALSDAGISLEYAYAFITPKSVGEAYVIIRVENNDEAAKVLNDKNIKIICQKDLVM